MSIGTIWNHRDFIERVYGKEDAIEFEQVVKKYQAEQIAIEQERIIKLLEERAKDFLRSEYDRWLRNEVVIFDTEGLIALIKGEK